ncbi:hypothetical protein FRB97_007689 [Tulasnella sp. 331]|nr:hypothetical protein FRB97_007689 [Tulasnella sp. 331]
MFKKDHRTKPSAPLKNSDRRKLRAQIVQDFNIQPPEDGDILAPEGIHSAKIITSLNESGIVYIDPTTADPLWFSIEKNGSGLIPTVYTLWKRPLLVSLSAPAAAIEKIAGGADLMIPGVISVSHTTGVLPPLPKDSLVAITEYGKSAPLGVGRLALALEELTKVVSSEKDVKGKAALVYHTFGDCLWAAGSKASPPDEVPGAQASDAEGKNVDGVADQLDAGDADEIELSAGSLGINDEERASSSPQTAEHHDLSPSDVDTYLRQALLQVVTQTISNHPHALPCLASTFLTNYLQPARPYPSPPLDLKKSTFKTFSKFLKTVDKEGLLKIKEAKDDITIVSVNTTHPDFLGHRSFRTVGEVEAREKARADRQKAAEEKVHPMIISQLWKPFGTTVALFEAKDKSISTAYTRSEVRDLLDEHIIANSLVHRSEAAFIMPDELLRNVLRKKGEEPIEFIRRNDLLQAILDAMQRWHSIDGAPPKKGALKPIRIETKARAAGRWNTIITGFEDYAHGPHANDLTAERLSEDLCKMCATATTSGPIPGASKSSQGMEVAVQGRHSKKVTEFLMSKGVPKAAIEEKVVANKKKK